METRTSEIFENLTGGYIATFSGSYIDATVILVDLSGLLKTN